MRNFALLLLILMACNGTTGGAAGSPPAEANEETKPDIAGLVTHIDGDHVRVEATPEEFRGDKAVVTITGETTIRNAAGRTLSRGDLRQGQRVRVWYTGAVAKSYPLQATASAIIVE